MWSATANAKTHRTDLLRGMSTWATATRHHIDELVSSEAMIKADTTIKPNPGTSVADYDACDTGESPLSCLRSTTTNTVNQNSIQEARKLAKDNMTPAD